jgi:homoserine kinase type II
VAVYTKLDATTIEQILGVYNDIGEHVKHTGLSAGSTNTNYRIDTTEGVFYLRIAENKKLADLVFERRVLQHLESNAKDLAGVVGPKMLANTIGGHFFPIQGKKYAMLFPELRGRELGVFELESAHLSQLGAYLARAHRVLGSLPKKRQNPYGEHTLLRWVADLERHYHEQDVTLRVSSQLNRVLNRRRNKLLPVGVIHGDLFMNNTKWYRAQLDAVFDWEMAGFDRLALDIGIGLNAWCWKREPNPEDSHFDFDLCFAFVDGYQSVRRLQKSEILFLFNESLLASLRFSISRIRDFEIAHDTSNRDRDGDVTPDRDYLDYREFERRFNFLEGVGDRKFRKMLGL